MTIESLIQRWSGECVVASFDPDTGTWMFIAIHDTTLGPAMGGCRMRHYDTPADGLRDAMRLAEGMTAKWATIGFALGGGKSVLAVPGPVEGEARRALLHRFGAIVDSLRGAYSMGEDLGTTPADMATIAEVTRYVHGAARNGRPGIDPGPYTALGVFSGIRAALAHTVGSPDPRDHTVLIQGVGDVGGPLAGLLRDAGARLLLVDVDARRAEALAARLGAEVVPADAVYETACDVYAPCAVGGTLNAATIPSLGCRIVAGSANNQLAEAADADRLHGRGILYAPDYVVNSGGATALPLLEGQGWSADRVRERLRGLEHTLGEIFTEASERGESPLRAAERRVERALREAKAKRA